MIRIAPIGPADWPAVISLTRDAAWRYEHFDLAAGEVHSWPGYLAWDSSGHPVGALGCWIDRPPMASIMYAAVDSTVRPAEIVPILLFPNEDDLRLAGAQALTYVGDASWLTSCLKRMGFVIQTTVVSYWRNVVDTLPAGNRDVTIRPAIPSDAEQIAALDAVVFDPMWRYPAAKHRAMIERGTCSLAAEMEGRLAGYQVVDIIDGQGVVVRLAVAPAYQHLGIGVRLMSEGLRFLSANRISRVMLNTQADNRASRRLYGKLGFNPVGEEAPALIKTLC